MARELYRDRLRDFQALARSLEPLENEIETIGDLLCEGLRRGRKVLICGNGGSAADAQHFAAEIVGRFQKERPAWPAVALTTDTSILTAVGNDYSFDRLFSRQVEALGREEDILIALSTSGNSANVVEAVRTAESLGMKTIGLLGGDGGILKDLVHRSIVVPSGITARVQEAHIFLLHFLAERIERQLSPS